MTDGNARARALTGEAIKFLAARCDGAHAQDGQGFNGGDADFGRSLAMQPSRMWSFKQLAAAYKMIRKYRGQLALGGIDYDAIPEPVEADEPGGPLNARPQVTAKGLVGGAGRILGYRDREFSFSWAKGDADFDAMKDAIKALPGRRFDWEARAWLVRDEWAMAVRDLAREWGFTVSDQAQKQFARRIPRAQQMAPAAAEFGALAEDDRPAVDPFGGWTPPTADLVRTAASRTAKEKPAPVAVQPVQPVLSADGQALAPKPGRMIGLIDELTFGVEFPYDERLVSLARELPGRRWLKEKRINAIPANLGAVEALRNFAVTHGFEISVMAEQLMTAIEGRAVVNAEASRSASSDFDVAGLGGELRPFQRAGVEYMVENKTVFLADEMGLGKTVQALAALQAQDAFPAVVVVPASLKFNWLYETERWLPGRRVRILEGRNAEPIVADFDGEPEVVILNYDILSAWLLELRALEPAAVIFDESHYVKNYRASRSKAADDLVNGTEKERRGRYMARVAGQYQVPVVYMLSGTPVLSRTTELLQPLRVMRRLDDLGGFWGFAERYTMLRRDGEQGFPPSTKRLQELNEIMRAGGFFARRVKSEVLPELPEKQWAVLPVAISNRAEYDRVMADFRSFYADRAVADEEFLASIAHLDGAARDQAIKAKRAEVLWSSSSADALTKIAALKQVAAQGKIEQAKNWIGDFLETDSKLVVFAWHREVVQAIAQAFDAPTVMGNQTARDRQAAVERFQNDPDCRLIVLNMRAGGLGLTLTAASDVLFLEYGWTPADMNQALDRCHRIGQRDSVTGWQMVGVNTIDEWIVELIQDKRFVVDASTEGEDMDAAAIEAMGASIQRALVARLVESERLGES